VELRRRAESLSSLVTNAVRSFRLHADETRAFDGGRAPAVAAANLDRAARELEERADELRWLASLERRP
jgi:hypothetical protein